MLFVYKIDMWYKKNFYNLGKTPCIWFHLLTFIADFQTNNTLELGTRVYNKKNMVSCMQHDAEK